MSRFFQTCIAEVHVASTPAQAEAILNERKPPLLLCDYWLGPEHPPGTALVQRWRVEHPCVVRAALMTGTKATAIMPTPGVDRVFQKPVDLLDMRDWFVAPQ